MEVKLNPNMFGLMGFYGDLPLKLKLLQNRKFYKEGDTKYVIENIIISVTKDVIMRVGKPERRFVVRIIDLKSNKSKNFSIYDGNEDMTLDKIHDRIVDFTEKLLGGKNE
jgi:hypothetical protein